ncbi:MAG TPA: hypothetical protein VM367_13270 [Pseudonocardia sp.]|nr:hypothetical protein [Pseudonocardia sp.]
MEISAQQELESMTSHDPADRDRHEEFGSFDGRGSVTAALAALIERRAAS